MDDDGEGGQSDQVFSDEDDNGNMSHQRLFLQNQDRESGQRRVNMFTKRLPGFEDKLAAIVEDGMLDETQSVEASENSAGDDVVGGREESKRKRKDKKHKKHRKHRRECDDDDELDEMSSDADDDVVDESSNKAKLDTSSKRKKSLIEFDDNKSDSEEEAKPSLSKKIEWLSRNPIAVDIKEVLDEKRPTNIVIVNHRRREFIHDRIT